jgi:hypothetical protein
MEVRTMDRQEAVRRAVQASGASVEGGGIRFAATHIAERDGQHLIFVSMAVQAYYLVVHLTGRVRDVGTEDDGITTSWVIQYFDVPQNPMRFGTDIAGVRTEAPIYGTENTSVGIRT